MMDDFYSIIHCPSDTINRGEITQEMVVKELSMARNEFLRNLRITLSALSNYIQKSELMLESLGEIKPLVKNVSGGTYQGSGLFFSCEALLPFPHGESETYLSGGGGVPCAESGRGAADDF